MFCQVDFVYNISRTNILISRTYILVVKMKRINNKAVGRRIKERRMELGYTQEQLSGLISDKLKMDFGDIIDLVPVERGRSGRICKLKIVGSKRSFTIGKELEIRRALSETHLYSSAFVVDKLDVNNGVPSRFVITGAGWGHGVGLCQIGAAVMGERGYSYDEILLHYYRGAEIREIYN